MITAARCGRLAVVGSPDALEVLRGGLGEDDGTTWFGVATDRVPDVAELRDVAADADAVLVLGPRRRAPSTTVPGPVVASADGRVVAAAWLPETGRADLARFAAAAARVRDRGRDGGSTVAVLAQRSRRYHRLAGRIAHHLGEPGRLRIRTWTAHEVTREQMLEGLGLGVGAAVYVGHGRPVGWAGYRGVRRRHLDGGGEPVGAVLSLTCLTASRRRTGLSFAEALPLSGAASASFAAVRPTDHQENARWALRVAKVVASRPGCALGEVVAAACADTAASRGYRIVGDPLAPLADAPGLAGRLRAFDEKTAPPVEAAP